MTSTPSCTVATAPAEGSLADVRGPRPGARMTAACVLFRTLHARTA